MENKEILVSVIIPVYNAALFLDQCLDSVVNQTLRDIEIICVDDGSTDNSVDIIKKYMMSDSRIKLFRQSNKGAGAARNFGLKYATGKYVHFLDSDDWLDLSAYEKTYGIIEEAKSDICIFLYTRYDNKKNTERKVELFKVDSSRYLVTNFKKEYWHFCNTSVVPWNKLYLREFLISIGAYFDEIICANDRAFYFQVITAATKIVKYPEYLIYYRENNDSSLVGSGREKHFDCHLIANSRIFNIGRQFDDEIYKRIVSMNMLDLFSFFTKCSPENKCKNFKLIKELLENNLRGIALDEFKDRPWYPNGKIALLSNELPKDKRIIPIVFATNNAYAPFLDVAIISLLNHCSEKNYYDIYVFETELCEAYIKKLESHRGKNYRVNTINLKAKLSGSEFAVRAHYSKEMYYRILIPELLYNFDKALYLDFDIIIMRDLIDLFNINISNYTIAAVHNALNNSMFRYVKNMLHLDPATYFNSGILIINIDKFTKEKIRTKCFDLLKVRSNLVCPDQDLLNLACRDTAKLIDSGWNYQWHGMLPGSDNVEQVSISSLKNAASKKYIIHYTSGKKAWSFPEYDDSAMFWEYVEESQFLPIIKQIGLCKRINATVYEAVNNSNNKKLSDVNNELVAIKKSVSYKIGRFLTWPFRMLIRFFKCLKDKGLRYTLIRIFKGKDKAVKYAKKMNK